MPTRLLALLTAAVLVLSACSDSDDTGTTATEGVEATSTTAGAGTSTEAGEGSSGSSDATLADIVDRLSTEPARFEGSMQVVGSQGSQLAEPIELPFTGSFDPVDQASEMSLDLGAVARAALGDSETLPPGFDAVFEEPMEVIAIGERSWIRFALLGLISGVETEWIEVSQDQTGELTSGLGLGSNVSTPTALLEQLRDADAEVTEVGTETVRDQETTHYRMQVDVARLAEQLAPEEQEQLEEGVGSLDEPLPVDVWVGEDDRLYRYSVEVGVAADDPEVESATVRFEFFDYGADIDIQPPPADQVTPMSELDSFLGDATGEGGTGGTGTEETTTTTTAD